MASGSFAEPIYNLIDELHGLESSKGFVLHELIKFLPGETIESFVEYFRKNHDMQHEDVEEQEYESNDFVLCMGCQDTHHEDEAHQCREIEYTDIDPQFFSSLIPEC